MKHSWTKVFAFTFRTTAGGKGYIATTLIVALMLLIAIPALMLVADSFSAPADTEEYAVEAGFTGASLLGGGISRAVVVGDTDMSAMADGEYADVAFENAADIDSAAAACEGDANAVIVLIEGNSIKVLMPEGSELDVFAADAFAAYLAYTYPESRAEADTAVPDVVTDTISSAEEVATENDMLLEIVNFVVPYVVVMLMYFMVLIYGQSVANSAIMEKTSKLMDLFLVSVKPSHMMLGKTMATAAAGLMQVLAWIFSAVGGCALGVHLVKTMNPETTLSVIGLFSQIGGLAAMFEPAVLITAALIIVAGFVMYCSLASIGGALAGKPEDLASANYLFSLTLVISFFACIFSGESPGMISEAAWMAYVPFTAVLVMPGRILIGAATVGQGIISAALIAVCAVVMCMISGKAYTALAFYKGKPLNPMWLIKKAMRRS